MGELTCDSPHEGREKRRRVDAHKPGRPVGAGDTEREAGERVQEAEGGEIDQYGSAGQVPRGAPCSAVGHISGCHLNPAVSFGLWAGGRFPAKELLPYIVAQVLGGVVAGGILYLMASGKAGFDVSAGFASNGYGAHSPGGYGLPAALITEVVMSMMFLLVILGATDERAPQGFAPIAIGLCLTLIHLISIPVTNTSVNPARSTGVALFVGDWAIAQLWLFWVAPIIGGMLGAVIYRFIGSEKS